MSENRNMAGNGGKTCGEKWREDFCGVKWRFEERIGGKNSIHWKQY